MDSKIKIQKQMEEAADQWARLCIKHIQSKKDRLKAEKKDEKSKRN